MHLFQELNQQGKTIVFVTHEPEIAAMSKRTITLRDGLIISDTQAENKKAKTLNLEGIPTSNNI
jgi:putative ABC transport system ATP-binding protein